MTRIVISIQNLSSKPFIFMSFFSLKIMTYGTKVDYDQRGVGEAISTKHTGDDMRSTNLFQDNGTLQLATPRNECARTQWIAPQLRAFGAVRDRTAGGSRPNGTEFIIFGCSSKKQWIRC